MVRCRSLVDTELGRRDDLLRDGRVGRGALDTKLGRRGTTFSATGESVVAPSAYTNLTVAAAKSRERWKIFSFIVPAHGQGEGATVESGEGLRGVRHGGRGEMA